MIEGGALLWVELDLLPAAVEWLQEQRRMKGMGPTPNRTPRSSSVEHPPASPATPMPEWSQDEILALKAAVSGHYVGVVTLFDLCAERGGWVVKADADELSGMTAKRLANQLRHFSTLVKQRFPHREAWPIEVRRWGTPYFYRLHPTVAEWWRSSE